MNYIRDTDSDSTIREKNRETVLKLPSEIDRDIDRDRQR